MKKLLSLVLAAAAAMVMVLPAFAANPKITKQIAAIDDVDIGEVAPGYKIWLPLVADAFQDASEDLTMTDVKTSKITVKQTVRSGSKAIASVEIKEDSKKKANILITLVDPFSGTKPLDFETTVTLYINGSKQGYGTVVTGTLCNEEITIYSDTDYVDISEGQIATCEETAKNVEVYIGCDISVFIKMQKGKQYSGTVSPEPTSGDDAVLEQYPDIEEVYTLNTVGLNGSGDIVKIDTSGSNYYVYDNALEYLGRTSDMLPFSAKYYLSAKKLDIIDEDEYEYDDEDILEPEDPEDEGSSESEILNAVAPAEPGSGGNSGGNPNTGTGKALGLAAAAGVLSLMVMVVLRRK